MQAIEFHTGIDDPAGFTLRLLRKAYGQGARVLVTADAPMLEHLSRQLWLVYEREFVAHVVVARSRPPERARTPIWLASTVAHIEAEPRIVINVGMAAPADPARLDRLIEVVSSDVDLEAEGRERWRLYKAAGLQISHFKAGGLV
jgi:DNA polymerase III subunit chi